MTSAQPTACDEKWDVFLRKIAQVLDRLEQVDSPHQLLAAIRVFIPFQFALSVVHQRDMPPILIADTFVHPAEKQALTHYVNNTYILNPVYNAYLKGLKEGVYRMRELAPDNYYCSDYYRQFKVHELAGEEIGYKTYGWPAGMEELLIIIALPQGRIGEISLSRASQSGGFSAADYQKMHIIAPLIVAIYRRLWQHLQKNCDVRPTSSSVDVLSQALDKTSLGAGRLSRRESEVAHMILQGHSSQSISLHLGISLTTVKSHRRNLYAKLNISTQQELFAAFLAALPTLSPVLS